MRLLFLHGAPAAGKRTVAEAILARVQGRLFDNHAAIDLARTVFDFGAPGFWELVHAARVAVLEEAARRDIPLIVMTFCYAEPEDRPMLEQFESIVQRTGGSLLPAYLSCTREETVRRLGNPDRRERRKIASEDGFTRFVAQYALVPVPRADCLQLETTSAPPEATARAIISHFGL